MKNRFFTGVVLAVMTCAAQATPIRVDFETNITTAYDYVSKSNVEVVPITGKFAVEFDDSNATWDRDEYGPYSDFGVKWITTPATSRIPLNSFFPAFPQPGIVYSSTFGGMGIVDVGAVPGYGTGYAFQSFGLSQFVNSSFFGYQGRESKNYRLNISLSRVYQFDIFQPLSTIDFLRTFVGQNIAGGTASMEEGYQFKRNGSTYEGLRYMNSDLKITAVTELGVAVPEPGTVSLMVFGVAIAGALRWRRGGAIFTRRKMS